MKQICKVLLVLVLIGSLFGCKSKKQEQSLLMTCDLVTTDEDKTIGQDYYGSKDVLEKFVQKTVYQADDKQELAALEENKKSIAEDYEGLAGVTYIYKIKKLSIEEVIEINIDEVELSTLIEFGMINDGDEKNISVSKTKELLESSQIAKCKLIDSND